MRHPSPNLSGTFVDLVCSFLPHHGPGESVSVSGCCTGPYYVTIRLDGPGNGSRLAGTSGTQGFVYAITPQAELADQSVIQGTFLVSCLWARVLFDTGASHSFIIASCVKDLGLEVETLEEPLHVSSPL